MRKEGSRFMALIRIVVLDGHALNPGDLSWEALRAIGELQVFDRTADDQVVARAHQAEIVMTNKTRLSAQILRQFKKTRYIGVLATGYDVVDVQAARELRISVTNIPTYGTSSVAEFTFALLLELCHHVALHGEATRAGEWSRSKDFTFWKTPLVELAGKTMGIIGLGKIGRRVAEIALAFQLRVIAADAVRSSVRDWPGFRWCEVDELLPQADVVSLHCPLLPETQGIVNAKSLSMMKPSAFLINTSRGPLVKEQDLADALNNGRLAGAAVDVLSSEPPSLDNPLLNAKNCLVTPHIAWASKEARTRLLDTAIANIRAFLDGHPANVVN
jgi:glycerate dehydrogenase